MTDFRLLTLLEKNPELMPTFRKREPFWRPAPPPPAKDLLVHVPSWSWTTTLDVAEDTLVVDLDVNAGYLSAASSVSVAHGALKHTGRLPDRHPARKLPGYFLVDVPYWGHTTEICSPLGTDVERDQVWVTCPTLQLLEQLTADKEAAWPDVTVYDSWTADEGRTVRLRAWASHIRDMRAGIITGVGKEPGGPYDDLKTAYSAAIAMMVTGEKCKTRRPDWAHAIVAQHAANTWRKAWRCVQMGCPPLAMGETDEITLATDHHQLLMSDPDRTPYRIDQSGITLGSLKVKRSRLWGEPRDA